MLISNPTSMLICNNVAQVSNWDKYAFYSGSVLTGLKTIACRCLYVTVVNGPMIKIIKITVLLLKPYILGSCCCEFACKFCLQKVSENIICKRQMGTGYCRLTIIAFSRNYIGNL